MQVATVLRRIRKVYLDLGEIPKVSSVYIADLGRQGVICSIHYLDGAEKIS